MINDAFATFGDSKKWYFLLEADILRLAAKSPPLFIDIQS
jgi:hypothetical protein